MCSSHKCQWPITIAMQNVHAVTARACKRSGHCWLVQENEKLKVDNKLWRERADSYLSQNIKLQGDMEHLQIKYDGLTEQVLHLKACQIRCLCG